MAKSYEEIENDMENNNKYKLVGAKLQLKKDIVPHKFKYQEENYDKPKRYEVKKLNLIKYSEKISSTDEESVPSTSCTPKNPEGVLRCNIHYPLYNIH
ncbi:hypothetical protein WA026_012437 [Henosepilachna vigintioctopunctata]|uniref:Uncharacterized protein n=1 Tax=Henosepilachna vigintioctopunctata TaxID=420089 RepID=A0AAW1V1C5_9CUCU